MHKGGITYMKRILISIFIFLIIILIFVIKNEKKQDEINLLKLEVKNLTSFIDDLVIQNNELTISVGDSMKTIEALQYEIDELNRNVVPIVLHDEVTYLNDKEIYAIYQKALKIYYWFEVSTLDADFEQKIDVENRSYFRVIDEITKFRELVIFMNSVLDYKIVDDLLSKNYYIDVDGKLYGIMADRGTHMLRGEETYEIIRISDNEIIYEVTVEVLDDERRVVDYETYNFYLKYYIDGKWRFDEFYLIR